VIVSVFDRRELRTPIVAAVALAGYAAWQGEWLSLVGLPLIYLAWLGCAPNLNLVRGLLAILSSAVASALGVLLPLPGLLAAGVACGVTWVIASVESEWRCRPQDDSDTL